MSRTHLYRASGPAKPLASIVLAALWGGAAILVLLATAPNFVGGLPLGGAAAGLVERLFALLAGAALTVGLGIVVFELVGGRTRGRNSRLSGGLALAVVGIAGMADTARAAARPGTPLPATGVPPALEVQLAPVHVSTERSLWTGAGTLAAAFVIFAGLRAVRRWESEP